MADLEELSIIADKPPQSYFRRTVTIKQQSQKQLLYGRKPVFGMVASVLSNIPNILFLFQSRENDRTSLFVAWPIWVTEEIRVTFTFFLA